MPVILKASLHLRLSASGISRSRGFINVIRVLDPVVICFGMLTSIVGMELAALWNLSDFANICSQRCTPDYTDAESAGIQNILSEGTNAVNRHNKKLPSFKRMGASGGSALRVINHKTVSQWLCGCCLTFLMWLV